MQTTSLLKPLALIVLFLTVATISEGQLRKRYRKSDFQLSLVSGVSTNGIHPAWYFNKFSFNIFSGTSAGVKHFEISGISSATSSFSTGIQIAGIANVVGTNTFVNLEISDEREIMKEELNEPLMHGIQLSGVINLVRGNVFGVQISGGLNIAYGAMYGTQWAGFGNVVNEDFRGVQLAGIYNVASRSVAGIQLASLANITRGPMTGIQLGMFNANRKMFGKNTNPGTPARSMQIGLFNSSRTMSGIQIGLINRAKEMSGMQIGLINFLSTRPAKRASKNGTPIGLLNFGSKGSFTRFSYNDQFQYNLERSTGNCANCSDTQYELPLNDDFQRFNQNSLIVSYNPTERQKEHGYWAMGWRFEKLMYRNYTSVPMKSGPQNGAYFLAWAIGNQHINWTDQFDANLSELTSVQATYGRRVKFLASFYLYITARINTYFYKESQHKLSPIMVLYKNDSSNFKYMSWLGYTIGIQV
uniref:LA_2272 family surface repeat-containing protein n=1 Tax=Fulvivirga sp. TaxID=1931237 RepID=UPI00404AB9EC